MLESLVQVKNCVRYNQSLGPGSNVDLDSNVVYSKTYKYMIDLFEILILKNGFDNRNFLLFIDQVGGRIGSLVS